MIRCAVVGAAGYVGGEVLRLLAHHPAVGHVAAVSQSHSGQDVHHVHADLEGGGLEPFRADFVGDADVIFLCMGHGKTLAWMEEHRPGTDAVVIDLGNDVRLEGPQNDFRYGLPEWRRDTLRGARRIANPGCFATAIELALLPLATAGYLAGRPVAVHAVTGSTGAGQAPSATSHYSWRADNLSVYKVFEHQHEAEIRQVLGDVDLQFVPVRGPFTRGIHASAIVRLEDDATDLLARYRDVYDGHPFTRVGTEPPDLKQVVGTNMCRIGLVQRGADCCIVSVIDNLLKGAAGQAVQNMNLALGLDETLGLGLKARAF